MVKKQLLGSEEALQETEIKFRELFHHANDLIFLYELTVDRKPRFLEVNDVTCQKLGYTREELLSMSPRDITDPECLVEMPTIKKELIEKDHVTFEWRYVAQNGHKLPVESSARVLTLNGEKVVFTIARDITERKRIEEIVNHLAYHDPLTDLPNRRLFEDRAALALSHAKRHHHMMAVLFLDLDSFKIINDSLGHDLGDLLLKAVTERLKGCVRKKDTIARIGGDEFTLLLPEIAEVQDAIKVAQKILEILEQPFMIKGHTFQITTSIGIALYPDNGADIDTLLKRADISMYRAKEQGKNNYRLYSFP
ncbi:hypothetical protein skT53_09980 [Effusibacillus dendaii]|uniref:Diguanylate cyclase n=2 Tax=Effusibacillus dendaii TaxID=2743772 RepID=A0A7I8D770_9BACL|nr:hypothetical protein skT53_09980 [Effusibacillus dendaii]